MSEPPKKGSKPLDRIVRRVVDGIEDAAEEAGKRAARAADRVEDAVERAFRGRGGTSPSSTHHETRHYPAGVTVNIDLRCCCCPGGRHLPTPGEGGGRPTRPGHVTGTSDGSLPGGIVGIPGVIGTVTRPPDVWPGPRTRLYLPLLFLRANAGDTGARPVAGVFWESPDILIAPGVDPAHAPNSLNQLGGTAKAGQDNTLYAHVWNLGQAPCPDTLVEFYWFDPSLGFSGDKANFVGATWVDLRGRGDAGSHRLVKCPVSWRAQFLNGGHECLVVRVSQPALDPLSGPPWDAARNRHIGQRNIHVMSAAEAAAKPTLPIAVGPLFGGAAQVGVARAAPAAMPWLHLVTMDRAVLPGMGPGAGDLGLTPPTPAGAPLPDLAAVGDPRRAGLMGDEHGVVGDGQQVGFHATDGDPGAGNAHVYRVTGTQDGTVFGGYTVVVLG